MNFEKLEQEDEGAIRQMSAMATEIVREHFDPLIGKEQNDYMLAKFQTVSAIKDQLRQGYRYYFVEKSDMESEHIGFLAFYPRGEAMYLSKFFLYKEQRGHGYAHPMLQFVKEQTRAAGLSAIELNVNRFNDACCAYDSLGFKVIRTEKNDIGQGFYMDDFVYRLDL